MSFILKDPQVFKQDEEEKKHSTEPNKTVIQDCHAKLELASSLIGYDVN